MATTEMGEYAVGAWLREIERCDFVNYNVRPPVSGQEGHRRTVQHSKRPFSWDAFAALCYDIRTPWELLAIAAHGVTPCNFDFNSRKTRSLTKWLPSPP